MPRFLWASFRTCLKIVLRLAGARRRTVQQSEVFECEWNLFVVAKDDVAWTFSWRVHAGTSWWLGSTNSQQESGTI